MAGTQRLVQGRRAFGLDGNDLRALADRRGAAGYKPAAAHRHQQGVEFRLLGEFQRDAARAGKHHRILVGLDDERAGFGGTLLRRRARLGIDGTDLMDDGAVALRRATLAGEEMVGTKISALWPRARAA